MFGGNPPSSTPFSEYVGASQAEARSGGTPVSVHPSLQMPTASELVPLQQPLIPPVLAGAFQVPVATVPLLSLGACGPHGSPGFPQTLPMAGLWQGSQPPGFPPVAHLHAHLHAHPHEMPQMHPWAQMQSGTPHQQIVGPHPQQQQPDESAKGPSFPPLPHVMPGPVPMMDPRMWAQGPYTGGPPPFNPLHAPYPASMSGPSLPGPVDPHRQQLGMMAIPPGMHPGLSPGFPQGVAAGMPHQMPPGMPFGMPQMPQPHMVQVPQMTASLEERMPKKSRVFWTDEMKVAFENAVNQLGLDKATPKPILEFMKKEGIEGLNRDNVASHLQKYRDKHRLKQGDPEAPLFENPDRGAQPGGQGAGVKGASEAQEAAEEDPPSEPGEEGGEGGEGRFESAVVVSSGV